MVDEKTATSYFQYKFFLKRRIFRERVDSFIILIAENYQKVFKKEESERLQNVKTLHKSIYRRLMKKSFYRTITCAHLKAYKNIKDLSKFDTKSFFSRKYGVKEKYSPSSLEEVVE